ncbi:MAG: DUF3553 domain-containing protein [Pseudomonadota bacterium]
MDETMVNPFLTPGTWVRHPENHDWGLGQIQSAAKGRITVNFEERGKIVINSEHVALEIVDPDAESG